MARFTILILSFLTLIGFGSWFIHFSLRSFGLLNTAVLSRVVAVAFVALPLVLVVTMAIGAQHFSIVNSSIYTVTALHLGLLSTLLMTVLAGWVGYVALRAGGVSFSPITIGAPVLALTIALFVIGIASAAFPKVTTQEISAAALAPAWSNKKIILISDTHFGMIRREKFAQKIIRLIEKENPDAIFIAGDLIDGPSFPYASTLTHFSKLSPSIGIFYTAGNHEEYNQGGKEFTDAIPQNITVLNDKSIVTNGTEIVGLTYESEPADATFARFSLLRKNRELPAITILHDPKNAPYLAERGSSLTLSGHTHGGQFYPFAFLVRALYGPLTKGTNYFGDGATFTTTGVGTAAAPFRLFVRSEIVVLKIR